MAQKLTDIPEDSKCKKRGRKRKNKQEQIGIENGFRRELHEKITKTTENTDDNGNKKVVVYSVVPSDLEVEKWQLPESSLSKYTCAIDGQEYTILVDVDPYSMFINDKKIQPRLSNDDRNNIDSIIEIESAAYDEQMSGSEANLKLFSCNVCKTTCPCMKAKRRYPYKHRWQVAYECEVCRLKVKTDALLMSHMKKHKKKVYECTFCMKTFKCQASINRHMHSHEIFDEPQVENENLFDDVMIYDAYTKILRLSDDADGIIGETVVDNNSVETDNQVLQENSINQVQQENRVLQENQMLQEHLILQENKMLQECQILQEKVQEIQNQQENHQGNLQEIQIALRDENVPSSEKLTNVQSEIITEEDKENVHKKEEEKPLLTLKIKRERIDELIKRESLKTEKKRRKQAKERLLRIRRRNKDCEELKKPVKAETPTRVMPQRNRKPPPRFNGADIIKEEFFSDEEDFSHEIEIDHFATNMLKDDDSDSDADEDPVYNPMKDDPSYYIPDIKEEVYDQDFDSVTGADPETGAKSDSSFDPIDFLPQKRKRIKKPWVCEICRNRYSRRNSLQRHYLVHSMEKPYKCDLCDKAFCIQSYLTAHRKIHFERKMVKCKICNHEFTRSSNLKAHMIIHVDFKPFSCRVCSKRFSHTSNLRRHEILHTGLKLHICMLCGKGFSLPSGLKEHMIIHDETSEPHRCDHCNKEFREYKKLRRHIDLHINEKKYQCLCCNRRFHQKTGLKRHLLTHTEADRIRTGADILAIPKEHKVPVVDAPEEIMAPVVKNILNQVDIQKITDAVEALDHELQEMKALNQEIQELKAIKSELGGERESLIDDEGEQLESQRENKDIYSTYLTQSNIYEPDPAEQSYIRGNVANESVEGVSHSEAENSFRQDEGYVSAILDMSSGGSLDISNWIKKEAMFRNARLESHCSVFESSNVNSHLKEEQISQADVQENANTLMVGCYDGLEQAMLKSNIMINGQYYNNRNIYN